MLFVSLWWILSNGTVTLLAEVGIEPTIDHQALDLAALPVCVLGCGGKNLPVKLRRPDSNRRQTAYETVLAANSSPLRSDQGGSRTHKHQALDLTAMPSSRTRPIAFTDS